MCFNVDELEKLLVYTTIENPRDELLYDIDPAGENIKNFKCPEINIEIENIQVKAL